MKSFKQQMEETRETVSQIACWCLVVALHQKFGIGAKRLERLAERMERLEQISISTMIYKGTPAAEQQRAAWLSGKTDTSFPVPLLRAPRGWKEQQLRMAGDKAASTSWQILAAACVDCFGFGSDRLELLRKEGRENYAQFNREAHEDGLEVAMEHLKRCAEDAMRQELEVVERDPEGWTQYEKELQSSERMAARVALSNLKAAIHGGPKKDADQARIFERCLQETREGKRVL